MRNTSSIRTWDVVTSTGTTATVRAPNWLVALGVALAALGQDAPTGRIATEQLPNGAMVLRDLDSGARVVVRALESARTGVGGAAVA